MPSVEQALLSGEVTLAPELHCMKTAATSEVAAVFILTVDVGGWRGLYDLELAILSQMLEFDELFR
jgi:hypothetical protein